MGVAPLHMTGCCSMCDVEGQFRQRLLKSAPSSHDQTVSDGQGLVLWTRRCWRFLRLGWLGGGNPFAWILTLMYIELLRGTRTTNTTFRSATCSRDVALFVALARSETIREFLTLRWRFQAALTLGCCAIACPHTAGLPLPVSSAWKNASGFQDCVSSIRVILECPRTPCAPARPKWQKGTIAQFF